ncbi:hypothetical protein OSTOST_10371 [Ostertagia ostertagi]
MTACTMQKQKRVTDFFSSPLAKKSSSLSPKLPIFELEKKNSAKKKPRLSVDEQDTKQTTLDAGQKIIGGQYCKEVGHFYVVENVEILDKDPLSQSGSEKIGSHPCEMMYSIESVAEVEMHKQHHNRLCDIAKVKVSVSQLNLWLRKERHYSSVNGSIFRIHPDSQSSLKRKVEQTIEEIVNPSVGFAPDLSIWGWDDRRTVWVSIITESSTHYIAGVVVTEPLLSAQCSITGEVY